MFSIGEFSKITGLTIKTLRFYHEQGILVPTHVDSGSGYRFYGESKVETARVIAALRELEFSIADISQILSNHDDDSDLLSYLESRHHEIQQRVRNDRRIAKQLQEIIQHERDANQKMSDTNYTVLEKSLEPMLIASVRMTGKYSECGRGFSQIGRHFGPLICGKPMMLCHDEEFRAEDANFEVAMPIKRKKDAKGIEVRELGGGRCLSLMHLGPYEELSRSYEKILTHAKQQGADYVVPSREVYHKGPGMIFRGNPKKYLTEIQLLIREPSES